MFSRLTLAVFQQTLPIKHQQLTSVTVFYTVFVVFQEKIFYIAIHQLNLFFAKILYMTLSSVISKTWITLACLTASAYSLAQSMTPEAQTKQFYQWYIAQQEKQADVFKDKQLKEYVSQALIKDIVNKYTRGTLDYDYFTNSQDYGEDWLKEISVVKQSETATTAVVKVTLGQIKDTKQSLIVTLMKDKDSWKIKKVSRAE